MSENQVGMHMDAGGGVTTGADSLYRALQQLVSLSVATCSSILPVSPLASSAALPPALQLINDLRRSRSCMSC